MNARRLACLLAAVAAIAVLPRPVPSGAGQQHEVGHWLGLYHSFDAGPDRPIIVGMVYNGDDRVPLTPTSYINSGAGNLKGLNCLEFEFTEDGQVIAYASYAPVASQTQETDWAFIQFHLEDGVSTEADLGYSDVRTSTGRCGAASMRVTKVDAFVIKQQST